VIQSKASQKSTASLSCDPIESLSQQSTSRFIFLTNLSQQSFSTIFLKIFLNFPQLLHLRSSSSSDPIESCSQQLKASQFI
jgi:hypothetical protein